MDTDSPWLDGMSSLKEKALRKATLEDIDFIVSYAAMFYNNTHWKEVMPLDEESLYATVYGFLTNEDSVVFINEKGALIATLVKPFMNPSHVMAHEVMWFAEENGDELREAFEEWGRERGAKLFVMSQIINEREKVMRRLYQNKGYKPAETTVIKEVA